MYIHIDNDIQIVYTCIYIMQVYRGEFLCDFSESEGEIYENTVENLGEQQGGEASGQGDTDVGFE